MPFAPFRGMEKKSESGKVREAGSVYAMVLMLAASLGVAVMAMATLSQARARHSEVTIEGRKLSTLLEGAAQIAAGRLREAITGHDTENIPEGDGVVEGTVSLDGCEIPYTLARADVEMEARVAGDGVSTYVDQFVFRASVTGETGVPESADVLFEIERTPLFQFGIFYGPDLEILPGPEMTVNGRVHANGDLHVDGRRGLTLETSYVRSAGKIYRHGIEGAGGEEGGKGYANGRVEVENAESGQMVYWEKDADSDSETWHDQALELFGGTVQSDVHGVQELVPPPVPALAEDGLYRALAMESGIVVQDGRIWAAGRDVTDEAPEGLLTEVPTADKREGAVVRLQTVNVELLNGFIAERFPGTFNGILWCGREYEPGDRPDGTQFVKASALPREGLTIVSDKPVYLQGDFNVEEKVPAAVMADAVTVLSKSWDNSAKLSDRRPQPAREETTVNAAILAGNVPSDDDRYSGGVQNLVRLLEDWSPGDRGDWTPLNITGSFVCLEPSRYATGPYGSRYFEPPQRNFSFDTDFLDLDLLPPGTPLAVRIARAIVWDPSEGEGP